MLPLPEHSLRHRLNAEIHSRPPVAIPGPEWISYLAVTHSGGKAADERQHLAQLCSTLGTEVCPVVDGDHWVLDAGGVYGLRLKWERHTEFSGYTFFRRRIAGDAAETTALAAFPPEWVKGIPGEVIAASHIELCAAAQNPPEEVLDGIARSGDAVVATRVAEGAAWVISDFELKEGFSRFTVIDEHLRHRQAGRTVQRILEIETYCMMALLAFPVAKETSRFLGKCEQDLVELMDAMSATITPEDERRLLAHLTRLAAEVEQSVTRTAYRFGAAAAYYRLVQQRVEDLREQRLAGFPPIREFMERRLAPAMATCQSVAARQTDLSTRIARRSALLRTRVDIELERQNQELLAQMNRRAKLQLRLQETVEGLSVVAITYYGSQLVQYLAKGLQKSFVASLSPEITAAVSIPVIAGIVALGIRRMRKVLAAEEGAGH